jgi:glutamate 5-kinase
MIAASAASNPALDQMAGDSKGELGRGGMTTKLLAARRAARSGAYTVILSGKHPDNLRHLAAGHGVGTLLWPDNKPINARQQWLVGHLKPKGQIVLDDGAVAVIREKGRSVLPVGVKHVEGDFTRGELVICRDLNGKEVARGLTNYNASEALRIKGHASAEIERLLGYVDEPELIHRDNLVVTG